MPGDILVLQNINKHFGGIRALIDVSLAVRKGEIHALVGENGAGKSTLIKILTGAIHRDSGEIWFNGQKQTIENPVQSREIGIAAIYQEVNLFPQLPVMYNLFFGNEPTRGRLGWLRSRSIRAKAGELLKKFGVEIDPSTPIGELGLGQKRIVEILKAISLNAQFLIMDEATTGMSRAEITTLFDIVRDLKERHVTVLYISHHLEEVFELADRVSVLRDGTLIDTFATEETSVEALSRAIVGREIRDAGVLKHKVPDDAVALEVNELLIPRLPKPISFTLKKGEILGITGVIGAGKTEIGRALFGVDPILSGSVKIFGREYTSLTPQKAKEIGLALVPEERKTQGIFPLLTVANNIIMVNIKRVLFGLVFLSNRKKRLVSQEAIAACRIVPNDGAIPVRNLSGGNQQKVAIAKWLIAEPRIVVLDEPTRGIDVGAKVEIRKLIIKLAESGVAVLYLTSEFKEVLGICDRVIVLKKGEIVGMLGGRDAKLDEIVALALG